MDRAGRPQRRRVRAAGLPLDFRQTGPVPITPKNGQPKMNQSKEPVPKKNEATALADAAFDEFTATVLGVPWGSLAKSELEFQVFRLLVAHGRIDLTMRDTALASELEITPARVRALRFKWDQRVKAKLTVDQMLSQIIPHALNAKGDELIIRVDSGYVLDRIVDELRSGERPVLVRSLRTVGHVQVDVIDFWIKVNALAGMSEEGLIALRNSLLEAFPDRAITKATSKWSTFLNQTAAATEIASFLDKAITVQSAATG